MTSRNVKVNERRPKFRSVVLGGSNPPLLQQTTATTGSAIPRPPSIAGRRIIRSSKVIPSNKSSSCCNNMNKNKTEISSIFRPTALRRVPFFYPIEKTHRVVKEDNTTTTDLLSIASRITNCLRNFSIQAVYDNQNARASLTTIEGVQMQLSLWDVSSKGEKSGNRKILVELQRRRGDCMTFHQYCRNILEVATAARIDGIKKSDHMKNSNGKRKTSTDAEHPTAKKQALSTKVTTATAATKEDEEYENTVVALEIAHTLLTKDRMDAKQLGLESLCFLTDPGKGSVSATARVIASQAVLFGTTKAPENKKMECATHVCQEIKEVVSSLISTGDEQEDAECEAQFHNLALTIFANALHVITILGKNGSADPSAFQKDDLCDNVISKLVEELSNTEKVSPHAAYLSTKCLRLLSASTNDNIKQKILHDLERAGEECTIVRSALNVGIRSHRKLELECKKFLEDILLPSN